MAINVSDLLYPTGYDSDFSTKTTSDLTEGSNLYYTTTRANSAIDARVNKAFVDALNVDADTLDNQNGTFYLDYTNFTNTPADSAAFETQFATKTTTNLPEGTNQYFTTTRARQSVSAGGDLSYVEGTGVFSVTTYKSADFDTDFGLKSTTDLSEGTNLYYTSVRADSDARNALTGGVGVTYTASTGTFDIGQSVGVSDSVQFGNALITGNLIVQGTTFTVNSTTVTIDDNIIVLNNNETGVPSLDAGFEVERGTSPNKSFLWDETNDRWTVGAEDMVAANFIGNLTGDVTGQVSDISNFSTTNLTEGTNLYFTDARARSAISVTDAGGDGSLTYNSGTGVITYTGPSAAEVRAHISGGTGIDFSAGVIDLADTVVTPGTYGSASLVPIITVDQQGRITAASTTSVAGVSSFVFDSANATLTIGTADGGSFDARIGLVNFSTSDLSEGTNLYYTQGRFDTAFAAKSTTNLSEGTNQYFTTTRARQSVSAGGDLSYVEGTGVFSVTTYKSTDFDTDFGLKSTTDLSEGTNEYFTNTRARNAISVSGDLSYDAGTGVISYTDVDSDAFVTQLAASSTTNLSEGTNLYYTQGRFDTAFAAKSTTDLSEGANEYFTNTRARNAISVSGDLSYDAGTGVISYTDVDSDAFVTQLAASSTSDLSEGTNLYYTDVRANAAIDARVDKAFVDALNVDADTLDGEDGTHYRIDVYDAAGTLLN